jgi:hypothetical protein
MLSVELEKAKEYGDIFAVVKKAVRRSTGQHRVGLMLFLGNLPIRVGAFHPMGTNDIVFNRRLLKNTKGLREKSHIFTILLHEYIHTLGYANERQVRRMTYRICKDNFPPDHPVLESIINGPWADLTEEDFQEIQPDLDLELVRDFERIDSSYII